MMVKTPRSEHSRDICAQEVEFEYGYSTGIIIVGVWQRQMRTAYCCCFAKTILASLKTRPSEIYPHLFQGTRIEIEKFQRESI
jgi:hypothetical protein